MKTAVYCSVFTLVSLWSLVALGQSSCHNGGGGYPGGQPTYPYPEFEQYDIAQGLPFVQSQPPVANIAPIQQIAAKMPAGPTAKITMISVNSAVAAKPAKPSAKLTIVPDEIAVAENKVEPAIEEAAVDERIAQLAGTWKAVARRGEGELTTVELRLDNRGWAEFTVPDSNGVPSTTKSRVNLENQELRLTGSDKIVSLGKLVNFDNRQMVLELAEGKMTFVRI